jgi:hypothetical protein
MTEEQPRKFDIPWGTLLPVLAVLAGVIAQFKPLVSTRPPVPSEKAIPVAAEQDADARLWQDPIAVAQKQEALLDAKIKAERVPKDDHSTRHDISTLAELLRKRAGTFPEHVLLLAVMLDAGPYSEQGESRLRTRQAVLEGLSESGFLPRDGEHIGFVTASWPPQAPTLTPNAPSIERALLLPWEECEPITNPNLTNPRLINPKRFFPQDTQGTKRVIVVWLPAVNFNPDPLRRFAALIDQLAPANVRQKVNVKLIGPANSTGLQNMVFEVHRWSPGAQSALSPETQKTLDGVSIISPRATASDLALLYEPSPASASEAPALFTEKSVKELLENSVPKDPNDPHRGLHFVRTIGTDDIVLREMIAELARRKIDIVPQMTPDRRPIPPKPAHIVILSEWDTPYGRSLGTTFAAEASGQSVNDIVEHPDKWPWWIHSYHYLRGIDGQLPGDPAKDNQRELAQKNPSGQESVPIEATEGLNQSDYLRRLARELKDDNVRWKRQDGFGIRAIGLLGSDIYDKLMILRALRPQFRDAVFFTNNYDARFERRDDWDDAHNLIIASPFGNSLPEIYSQQHIAPFRDSNQTSTYVGTLVATGRMDESVATDFLFWQPRIFEISRRGAYDLSPLPGYLEGENFAASNKAWFRDWLFSGAVLWQLAIASLALLAIAAWIGVTIASPTLPRGGTTPQRLRRIFASTTFWLTCCAPLIVLWIAVFSQSEGAAKEPLAFFSGISIWPTEMLRLIVFMLAIQFMVKAGIDLRANERKLTKRFHFAELGLTPFRWADLGIGLERWRIKRSKASRPKARFHKTTADESEISAEEAWHAYLCRNKFWPRFIRIGILVTLYSAFSFTLISLFRGALPPARGEAAFKFDRVALSLAVISMMILSFYVVDAIQLNSNFIRMFAREVTKWGDRVVLAGLRNPPLGEKELSPYHEILFVAQRTQVVARLIWYPLIVLSLMFVARSSFFDNWTWPASLVIIFALNAAWPIGSAVLLRRAAEQLRDDALSDLERSRIESLQVSAKLLRDDALSDLERSRIERRATDTRETLDELIAEVRGLKKGAFAPLTEQPFVRAIIVPSGGLGLLAVGQRLLDIF